MMYRRVLLPLDRSAISEQAVPHALAQARRFGSELILLRVLEPLTNVRGLSDRDLEEMRAFLGEVKPERRLWRDGGCC